MERWPRKSRPESRRGCTMLSTFLTTTDILPWRNCWIIAQRTSRERRRRARKNTLRLRCLKEEFLHQFIKNPSNSDFLPSDNNNINIENEYIRVFQPFASIAVCRQQSCPFQQPSAVQHEEHLQFNGHQHAWERRDAQESHQVLVLV